MLAGRFALVLGLVGALLTSQFPAFAHDYRQRLGGVIDELTRIVAQFDAEVASQNLTRDQGIERLRANVDWLAQRRGADMRDDVTRLNKLEAQRDQYDQGGSVTRLVAVARDFDPGVARNAYKDFEPAIPVTTEALVSGGLGLVLGWFATHVVVWPFRRRVRPGMRQAGLRRA